MPSSKPAVRPRIAHRPQRAAAWLGCMVPAMLAVAAPLRGAELSTETLLEDLVDLDRLTRLPDPPYVTRQFSSYNRASRAPDDPQGWFANFDRGHFIRTEDRAGQREYVMMDAQGPGVIVRIWSASNKGIFRFYIDGSDVPTIEAPLATLLGGTFAGVPEPLAGCRARGFNLYFPIVYARHCKVTCDVEQVFYHFNYRTYPPGTPARSFQPADLVRCAGRIAEIAAALKDPRTAIPLPATHERFEFRANLAPGQRVRLFETKGPAAVCDFAAVLRDVADPQDALRTCVLEMHFDGEHTVDCPLGDFFGTAPGLTPYASLVAGIAEESPHELWSHWRMPFNRLATAYLRNLGAGPVALTGRAVASPRAFDSRTCLFHAGWRIERDLLSRPFSDWTHLDCRGTGRFVGSALSIMNPVRKWWGEGDEKIYVDGETFPSHFGTGSEDYYGYAWCSPERFVHAYHNQPRCDGPGNYGHTSVNRFHIIDDIPFTTSLRFDMENWHHNPITRTTRAAVSYWYARPGATDSFKPIGAEQVVPVHVPPFEMPRIAGAIEGESLRVTGPATTTRPAAPDERFSNGGRLLWTSARAADRLELAFDLPAEGQRRVWVRLMLDRKGPRVRLAVNGQSGGPEIDLSHERTTPTESEIDLGSHSLHKSENRLSIEVLGGGAKTPPQSVDFTVGVDYVRAE